MLSFETLKSEFDSTKDYLSRVESNIKKLTGRDADQYVVTSDGNIKLKDPKFIGKGNLFNPRKRKTEQDLTKTVEEKESSPDSDEDVAKKHSLQSAVVAAGKNAKTRKDLIKDQYHDSSGMARNRRIFNFVRGTLKKFQHEEGNRILQEKKKADIYLKLEEAAEKEKVRMKAEQDQMFLERREKKMKLRCLEKKMEVVKMHEVWEKSQNYYMNFIKTENKPYVLWLPVKHNVNSKKLLEEEKERRTESINARRTKVNRELFEIDDLYTREEKNEENWEPSLDKIKIFSSSQNPAVEKEKTSDAKDGDKDDNDQEMFNDEETMDKENEFSVTENVNAQEEKSEISDETLASKVDDDKGIAFNESFSDEKLELIYDE